MIRLGEGSQRLKQMRYDRSSVHVVGSGEWLDERSDAVDDDATPLLLRHFLSLKKAKDENGRKCVDKIKHIERIHRILQVKERQTRIHVGLHLHQQLGDPVQNEVAAAIHIEDASLHLQAAAENRHRQLRLSTSRRSRDHRQVVKQDGITQQRIQSILNKTENGTHGTVENNGTCNPFVADQGNQRLKVLLALVAYGCVHGLHILHVIPVPRNQHDSTTLCAFPFPAYRLTRHLQLLLRKISTPTCSHLRIADLDVGFDRGIQQLTLLQVPHRPQPESDSNRPL